MGARIPQLLEQAAAAAAYAAEQIYRRHPELLVRFGENGKRSCEEEIAIQVAYIDAAVETDSAVPLVEYLLWLQEVLRSRGLPDAALAESVHLVGEYFEDKLAAPEMALLQRIVCDGVDGLAKRGSDGAEPAYMKCLPSPLPEALPLANDLIRGAVGAVRRTVDTLHAGGATYLDIAVRLFQPALYRIGIMWQNNLISVAREHLATTIVQNHLALAFSSADYAAPIGRRALFACVQGNHHAVGLRMISDTFELAGWETHYLGSDLPLASLLACVDGSRPQLVGLSVSLGQQIPTMRTTIAALRGELGRDCPPIMVGGLANNQVANLWKIAGADLWAPSADRVMQSLSS